MKNLVLSAVCVLGSVFLISCSTFEGKDMNAEKEKAMQSGKSCGSSPNGSTMTGYAQSSTPKGVACPMVTRTCVNGAWMGPEIYNNCQERP